MTSDPATRRLGATVVEGATRFEVWAPDASLVEVASIVTTTATPAAVESPSNPSSCARAR